MTACRYCTLESLMAVLGWGWLCVKCGSSRGLTKEEAHGSV